MSAIITEMALRETEAFVLRSYPLGEADKIVVFLTRDFGKTRGVAHGARKMRSRFGSSLEPFTETALTFYEKEGRELVNISSCEIVRSHFRRASGDVETASAFSYMAELLVEFLPEREPNERVYRLVVAIMEAIESGRNLDCLLRYFETWLLRLVGFFPDAGACSTCGEVVSGELPVYLTSSGEPRCATCSGGRGVTVTATVRRTITRLLKSPPAAFAESGVTKEDLDKMREINYQIVRHALERDLRSRSLLELLAAL